MFPDGSRRVVRHGDVVMEDKHGWPMPSRESFERWRLLPADEVELFEPAGPYAPFAYDDGDGWGPTHPNNIARAARWKADQDKVDAVMVEMQAEVDAEAEAARIEEARIEAEAEAARAIAAPATVEADDPSAIGTAEPADDEDQADEDQAGDRPAAEPYAAEHPAEEYAGDDAVPGSAPVGSAGDEDLPSPETSGEGEPI